MNHHNLNFIIQHWKKDIETLNKLYWLTLQMFWPVHITAAMLVHSIHKGIVCQVCCLSFHRAPLAQSHRKPMLVRASRSVVLAKRRLLYQHLGKCLTMYWPCLCNHTNIKRQKFVCYYVCVTNISLIRVVTYLCLNFSVK